MELENQKEQHRERIEVILLYATLGFTGALAIAFTIVLFLNPKNPDLQKYAMTGILSILTAWIGFAAGKASTKSGG